jgi:hypothetical protein
MTMSPKPKTDKVFSPKDARELKAREDELSKHIRNTEGDLRKLKETKKKAQKLRVRHYGPHCPVQ